MMMTQVANHSKRNHTDGYFSGKQQQQQAVATATATTSSGSEEFAAMGSKKPRNASPRGGGPISPKEKKDKVGERVAALQQLVSPFGKTDTASVLQEASGYIKFLHQQLEVLSSPYMRPPPAPGAEPEDPEHYSLRNRGLCLVPVEQTLQLTQSNGPTSGRRRTPPGAREEQARAWPRRRRWPLCVAGGGIPAQARVGDPIRSIS